MARAHTESRTGFQNLCRLLGKTGNTKDLRIPALIDINISKSKAVPSLCNTTLPFPVERHRWRRLQDSDPSVFWEQ